MIQQKMQADQLAALKSGDKTKLEILRYILAHIKNKEIDKKAPPTDEEVVAIVRKQVKELQESIDAFKKGGRNDLVLQNEAQLAIVSIYLPVEISDDELKKEIQRVMEQNKTIYEQNPKALMGICVKELKTKANPQRIVATLNQIVAS
ncbi:MAG: GatB/YqeY domain-containing protein [bacterium]|nr:GatB/YqeY domain-containing protein [bacterium]